MTLNYQFDLRKCSIDLPKFLVSVEICINDGTENVSDYSFRKAPRVRACKRQQRMLQRSRQYCRLLILHYFGTSFINKHRAEDVSLQN